MSTAAMVPVFFTATVLWAPLVLTFVATAGLFLGFRRAGWLHGPASLDSVAWNADGRWFLSRGNETWEARLNGDSWSNRGAMLLRWESVDGSGPRFSMLFTALDLGLPVYRRLFVRLRIEGARATTATDSLLARDRYVKRVATL